MASRLDMAHQQSGYAPLPSQSQLILTAAGKENIRRTFYNGKEASQDIITKGTYGFVFRITKDDDEKLHAVYGLDRVRIAQYVQIKTPGSPNGISALPVMIYWDPRNTRDGSIKDKFYGSMNEQHKWSQGFMRLKAAGVPHWYIERILEILMGLKIDKDPIYVDPKDLLYTLPTTPTLPQQQNSQDQSQGQTMIGRAERAISARIELTPSRAQSNGQPKSTARPQSTSGPRPAARPQPAATPKLHPASTGPNIKVAKKRQSDFGDEEAQPAKRKKLPPGPSNLSRSTLA